MKAALARDGYCADDVSGKVAVLFIPRDMAVSAIDPSAIQNVSLVVSSNPMLDYVGQPIYKSDAYWEMVGLRRQTWKKIGSRNGALSRLGLSS